MAKTHFNDAVIGNSSMLGCLTRSGEIVRLFWPNIDYPQHIDSMQVGVFFAGSRYSTMWLHGEDFSHSQRYISETNILETVSTHRYGSLKVIQLDYVLPEIDILVRSYQLENTGDCCIEPGIVLFSSFITTNPDLRSTLFDFDTDSLIFYSHKYYISFSSKSESYQFQLGNNAYEAARSSELCGNDSIGMMSDAAVSWKLGCINPGERRTFTLNICASDTLKGVKSLVRSTRNSDASVDYENTRNYWHGFLRNARQVNTGRSDVDNLYKRSLLVFKLMADKKAGGLLAAPEIDEEFTRSGRYAYCWLRDAAFITSALDRSGLTETVDKFYKWAAKVQDDDGVWHQRYHIDGNLAPSWGIQIDETGTAIWGMLQHFKATNNVGFLREMWGSVKKAVGFLTGFMDPETGLPAPSFDLWEERFGEHAYSSAAVYGGIKAAIEIAGILGETEVNTRTWELTAENIRKSILRNFWKEHELRFIRSVRTKLNPWGAEPSSHTTVIKVNPKGHCRDVTFEDWTVDISLLGLSVPFDVFEADDGRIEKTAGLVERVLTVHNVGGIKRYEHDNYIGGNPWIIATLWLALYYIKKKDYERAKSYFEWAVKGRTELDLLPEQVSRDDGRPAWVIPLTWSHAMFVLVLIELYEAGII